MVGPASTTSSAASAASAASGQRKFKSSPGLLWVCIVGTVLVLLAQPYGVSADTHHQQRRKLVKTTDAAGNQVLTKRAFGGTNAMSTNNNNNADELAAAAVADAGGRRLKSSKNSKSADVKSSDVYSASDDSDSSKSSKASKNSKSSDVQSSSVYASSSSSKGSKGGKSSKSSKSSKGSKGSSSSSGSGDDDDDDDSGKGTGNDNRGTGDDHKKPDRDDDGTGDDHKKSPTKKSPPPKKSPTKKSEPKKSHSKNDDKHSTGNDYDDGEQFFCDGFDPSNSGDSGDDDYTKFRVRFEYEFYDDEDDLMDFEMDLAKFVSKEVMDGCMRRRSLRTGTSAALAQRGLGSEDVLGLDSNPPDVVVDDCDTEKKCHHVKGKMTVYVANDAKKAKVGCSIVESIAEYMSKSKDAMFVDSATCDISKGRSGTTLQPRSAGAGVGGKVAGALAALAVAMAAMFACRQTQKKRSEQHANDEEYNDYVGKLQNDSLDTYSVASTQDGSVTRPSRNLPLSSRSRLSIPSARVPMTPVPSSAPALPPSTRRVTSSCPSKTKKRLATSDAAAPMPSKR